jgi:hypothetical protein
MKLWLDDIRDPKKFGHDGTDWIWVKTADEAIICLKFGNVTEASLDHDLTDEQMEGGYLGEIREDGQKSGYDVVRWLELHPQHWPPDGVKIHSMNPAGRKRMQQVIDRHYNRVDGFDDSGV